jgi:hypothetical protein
LNGLRRLSQREIPNERCTPEMSTEAPGFGAEMLSKVSEKCTRSEAKLQRTQLSAVLCEHTKEQAPESWLVSGEENSERCMEIEPGVSR